MEDRLRALLAEQAFDLCFTDMRLPDGNGIDLARRMHGVQLYGMTCPLLLKSDGTKMGKTERDQAAIVFKLACKMVALSPERGSRHTTRSFAPSRCTFTDTRFTQRPPLVSRVITSVKR